MTVEFNISVIYLLKVHTTAASPPRTHAASSARLALRLFSIRQRPARILILLPAVSGGGRSSPTNKLSPPPCAAARAMFVNVLFLKK